MGMLTQLKQTELKQFLNKWYNRTSESPQVIIPIMNSVFNSIYRVADKY
ncbi:hypothetical protein CRE_31301 [Caenorhabditis remanei]|uniref:Uncharacterized protein n=1 Tax=Caenorhabditis remanei TaxID=31234 RepID=E3MLR3_CAERE|nr:hypothetical protein CRE_31301 [Caenorhabditis remanei]